MKAALVIARRELLSLFVSPMAWTLLAVVQALAAWVFLVRMDGFAAVQPRLADLPGSPGLTALVVTPLLRTLALLMVLVVPLVTMRMLSGERRDGTLVLLLAAPVSAFSIVFGKYLAALGFFLTMLALLACLPLTLLLGGSLDGGLLLAATLGMLLLIACFSAVGLYFSSLTSQPPSAAGASTGLLLLLWMFDWTVAPRDGADVSLLAWLSPAPHLDAMLRGLLDSADVGYFVVLTAGFLYLAMRRVEGLRSWD